jgi:hypothetical protein
MKYIKRSDIQNERNWYNASTAMDTGITPKSAKPGPVMESAANSTKLKIAKALQLNAVTARDPTKHGIINTQSN